MSKQEINETLKSLLSGDDNAALIKGAKPLLAQYQTAVTLKHREALEAFTQAGGEPQDFVEPKEEEDVEFDSLWAEYLKRKASHEKAIAEEHAKNLGEKKGIIEAIRELSQNEEHVGKAFNAIRELEEKWKTVGNVSPHDYKDLQNDYSRARDDFYYQIRIYKELLENDLKKNLGLKEELADKMERLFSMEDIREAESLARRYLIEWDEVGPTFKEKWEEIRDRFRNAQHRFYDRLKNHYKSIKEQQAENLAKKEALCDELEAINAKEITSEKAWRKLTDDVIAKQKAWKAIGFATKKENKQVWERFKKAADEFFDGKSAFFKQLKEQQDTNKKKKLAIIEEANVLKTDTNWKETGNKLIALQKKWQSAGKCHQRDEQKLWKQFRAACNEFFDAKKTYYDTLDSRLEENAVAKNELLDKIEAFTPGDDNKANRAQLKAFSEEYGKIGFVPRSKKNAIQDRFKAIMDKHYKALGVSAKEQEKMRFSSKLNELSNSENSRQAISSEIRTLQDRIRKLEHDIRQTENNLGFFAQSKGAESLLKQQEKKIEQNKTKLAGLKDQLKAVYELQNKS